MERSKDNLINMKEEVLLTVFKKICFYGDERNKC